MWRSIFRRGKDEDEAGFDKPLHVLYLTLSPGREQLRADLERRGVVATLIEDGSAAVAALEGGRIDGIILDELTPAAGGKVCYRQLAEHGSQHEIPLVWIIKPLIRSWPGPGYQVPANVLTGKVSAGKIVLTFRLIIARQLTLPGSSYEHYFRGYTDWAA